MPARIVIRVINSTQDVDCKGSNQHSLLYWITGKNHSPQIQPRLNLSQSSTPVSFFKSKWSEEKEAIFEHLQSIILPQKMTFWTTQEYLQNSYLNFLSAIGIFFPVVWQVGQVFHGFFFVLSRQQGIVWFFFKSNKNDMLHEDLLCRVLPNAHWEKDFPSPIRHWDDRWTKIFDWYSQMVTPSDCCFSRASKGEDLHFAYGLVPVVK